MGQQAHPEIIAQFGTVQNQPLQSYFDQLGKEMARTSHRPELPWTFAVVDSPVVNAFAVPGGFIYFTRGIISYMNNEAELAGVLGHEIGHVTARHSVSQMSKAQLFGLGLGIGSILSPTFRQLSGVAQTGIGLLFLKYSRDAEREADRLGVEYSYQVGYDPRELSDFFQVFQRMREESGQAVPNWLSSHPAPPERVEATQQLAQEYIAQGDGRNLVVDRSDLLRKIDGMIFGENPREGFNENGRFYHPDLKFQMDYPDGWNVQNTKQAVGFVEPNRAAIVQLTLAANQNQTPEGRAREVSQMQNVRLIRGNRTSINGLDAFVGLYQAQIDARNVTEAMAAFVRYEGRLYEIFGLAAPGAFSRYSRTLEQTMLSFRTLTDRRILAVEPDRLDLHQARAGETLSQIARQLNNPRVDADDLSLLNRIEENRQLSANTMVKVVVPGRR